LTAQAILELRGKVAMHSLNTDQLQILAAAVMQVLHENSMTTYAGKSDNLIEAVLHAHKGSFDADDIRNALRAVEHLGAMTQSQLGATSDFIRIERHLFAARFARTSDQKFNARKLYPLLFEYSQFGSAWLDDVWDRYFPQETSAAPVEHNSANIPAADRLVTVDHNSENSVSARSALSDLSAHLASSNDFGDLSIDEVEEAKREVWLLEQAIMQEAVRIDWIEPMAKACLKWIALKAAEQTIGAFAIAALTALAILFGFSI